MTKRSSKRKTPKDPNELAAFIVEQSTAEPLEPPAEKNPAAVALGRLGGKKSRPARAKQLTLEQRHEIAKKRSGSQTALAGKFRPEACAILMRDIGKRASIKNLIPQLFDAGLLPSKAASMWYKVRNAVDARPDLFVKVGPGKYALATSLSAEERADQEVIEPKREQKVKPVRDGVLAILTEEEKPLHYSVLMEKLQQWRVIVGGKHPKSNFIAHLSLPLKLGLILAGYPMGPGAGRAR